MGAKALGWESISIPPDATPEEVEKLLKEHDEYVKWRKSRRVSRRDYTGYFNSQGISSGAHSWPPTEEGRRAKEEFWSEMVLCPKDAEPEEVERIAQAYREERGSMEAREERERIRRTKLQWRPYYWWSDIGFFPTHVCCLAHSCDLSIMMWVTSSILEREAWAEYSEEHKCRVATTYPSLAKWVCEDGTEHWRFK